jgi:hypothetical protein
LLSTKEPAAEPNEEPEPAFRLFAFRQFGSLIVASHIPHLPSSEWEFESNGKVRAKGTTWRGSCDPATVDRGREKCFR